MNSYRTDSDTMSEKKTDTWSSEKSEVKSQLSELLNVCISLISVSANLTTFIFQMKIIKPAL